jgi:hypothetical protein
MTADAPLGETPWRKPLPKGEDRTASPMPNAPCPIPHPLIELIMQRVDFHHSDESERIQTHFHVPYFLDT